MRVLLTAALTATLAFTVIKASFEVYWAEHEQQTALILDRPSETDSSPRLDINATSLPLAWKEAHPRLLNSEITCRCSETFDCFAAERSRRDLPESEYTVVLELEDFPGYRIPTADERNGYDDRCIEHGLLIAWQAKDPITLDLWRDIVASVGLIMSSCAYSHNELDLATGQSFEADLGLVVNVSTC